MAARRVVQKAFDITDLTCPTCSKPAIENTANNPVLSDQFFAANMPKKPERNENRADLHQASRIGVSRHYRREHRATARMLAHTLTLSDETAWDGFTALIGMRLSLTERVSLAYAALMALDDNHAFLAAEAALWGIVRPERGATNG